jgi:hypothetical protein
MNDLVKSEPTNLNPIKNVIEILEECKIKVIKVNSQKSNKYFLYKKNPITNYNLITISTKSDVIDEIINKFNASSPNWYLDITAGKNQTLSKGKKELIDYISYDCMRVDDIINDPANELFFNENNKLYFNLFQNYKLLNEDIKDKLIEKDWSVIRKVLWELSGENEDNYEWIINWFAILYQYPTYRFTTSIIFIGMKGSGKGMLSLVLRYLFGTCSYTANSTDLTSNFNAQLFEGKMLLLANEILDTHNKYQFSNNLKDFVTENIISVEKKFCDRYQAKNYIKLVLFSNSNQPISIEEDDRRYAVFYTNKKIKEVIDYHTRSEFFEQTDFFKNQVEGLAYFLYNYLGDISKVTDEPIMTQAKKNIITVNLTDFRCVIDDIIESNTNNFVEDRNGLYYIQYLNIFLDYQARIQEKSISLNKNYPKNKFGTKLRLENYLVYNFKSINSTKATWVEVPLRVIKKVYIDDPQIIEKVEKELSKRKSGDGYD